MSIDDIIKILIKTSAGSKIHMVNISIPPDIKPAKKRTGKRKHKKKKVK